MLKYLLDTNIVIYVVKRRPLAVLDIFNRHHGRMAVSAITVAELIHGAEKSEFPARNLAVVEDFFSHLAVLPYTGEPRGITAASARRWKRAGNPSASMTCTSPATRAVSG